MSFHQENAKKIKEYNSLSSDIYLDRKYYFLTKKEISTLRGIPLSQVEQHIKNARFILKHYNEMWCRDKGLSRQSALALLRNGYRNFESLVNDLFVNKVDLTKKDSIGEGKAREIIKWVNSKSK